MPLRTDITRSAPKRLPGRHGGVALLVALMLAGSAAGARADQPSAKLCTKAQSTPETQLCMEKAFTEADKKLNAAYQKALSVIDHDDGEDDQDPKAKAKYKADWKARLAAAQRAWIAFRDADCGDLTISEWHGGTGMGPALDACKYDKTVQRTDDLLSRYPLH